MTLVSPWSPYIGLKNIQQYKKKTTQDKIRLEHIEILNQLKNIEHVPCTHVNEKPD